jgi:hypothetical protein
MESIFIVVFIVGVSILSKRLVARDKNPKAPHLLMIAFSSLFAWIIPLVGLIVAIFLAAAGWKFKNTGLGKFYLAISTILFFVSVYVYIDAISRYVKF